MTNSEANLMKTILINYPGLDAIVVEGYDGVGKGKLLNLLAESFEVIPYRPDYNLWQQHDHRYKDRWKVSGFFWDVYSHFNNHTGTPMLFDRGVISGAVYGKDDTIASHYKQLLRDMKVLHVLVCCNRDDFVRFQKIRNPDVLESEISCQWSKYQEYTARYIRYFDLAGVDYILYYNEYSESEAESLSNTCAGCGHYSYGICRHPNINKRVSSEDNRCELSREEETQDMEVNMHDSEMQCV